MRVCPITTILPLVALLTACGTASPGASDSSPTPTPAQATPASAAAAAPAPEPSAVTMEPQHVRLQHILIGFKGTVPGKDITRSQEEARSLAAQLLDRAKKGEDFDALVKEYTDDQYPGVYALANRMVTPAEGEFSRDRMIAAFGEVGFPLQIGEIGMAQYEPRRSPYGWHIIKRIS